jgi:hypothetical protein
MRESQSASDMFHYAGCFGTQGGGYVADKASAGDA